MVSAFLIALREGVEAALIVGIVMGYLLKLDRKSLLRWAWLGVAGAVALSVLLGVIIHLTGGELEGEAEEIFEGATMLLAVGVLTWMIFWMRTHSRNLKSSLEEEVFAVANSNRQWGIAALTFLAVFREGIETALFLAANAFNSSEIGTVIGTLIGLGSAALLGYFLFATTIRLNLRAFFDITSILLLIFAAGLLAHGIHELQEAALIPTLQEHVWNINPVLDEDSGVGKALEALLGYNGNPSLEEVLAYVGYWIVTLLGIRWWVEWRVSKPVRATDTLMDSSF
jgi:high-affinity iron transporter